MSEHKQRRNTPQRKVILEELSALQTHPTAAELFSIVREKLPRISLGTVYRNLEVLHQEGMVNKLELAGAETRFDAMVDPHLHIRCSECGRIDDLPQSLLPVRQPEDLQGYLVQGCRLEYFGVCPDCRPESRH